MDNKVEWRNWGYIARAIAAGAKREEIADYLDRTNCRYCAIAGGIHGCECCPLHEPGSKYCAGGYYRVVYMWAVSRRARHTRAEALRSARIIAEVTGD